MYLEPPKSGLLNLGAQQQVPRTENKLEMRENEKKFEDHIEEKTENHSENKTASRSVSKEAPQAENKSALRPKNKTSQKPDNKDGNDSLKKEKSNVIFLDALESLFLKMNLNNLNDDVKKPAIPFSPQNKNETQLDDMNFVLNSMFTPACLLQANLNQNFNVAPQVQEKAQNLSVQNNSMKIDSTSFNNFELGEYKLFPILTDKFNISKNDLLNLEGEKPSQNFQKFDLVDANKIKNEFNPYQNLFETKLEPIKNLQKGDLVILNTVETKNNDVSNLFPKINIEISNIEPNIKLMNTNNLDKNIFNYIDKINENQKTLNSGNNFFGYPVYRVEKENIQVLEGNNQNVNFDIGQNQETYKIPFIKTKTSNEILSKVDLKNSSFLNSFSYQQDFTIQTDTLEDKKLFKIPAIEKQGVNIVEKDVVANEVIQNTNAIDLKNSFSDLKPQLDSFQNANEGLKSKNIQDSGGFKFNQIVNEKKVFDLSKNSINHLNSEKSKIDFMSNKNIKDDSFFSFMSSDSGNDTAENKQGVDEKVTNDNKGILFEKGITSQHALPITVSDNSKSDFSNPLISAGMRRAVDLSSQLQARGGGTAKIQIQDEKFGSIELSIHMKKDNTVSMEIKASDRDLKATLEKNSDTLKKSLDVQNISLTEFKVSTVEKSAQTGMGSSSGQGFSQQQSQQNFQNSQDLSQQAFNQGFSQNNFTNSNGQFFKNNDDEFSFNKNSNNGYINKSFSGKSMEKNAITNIQRGANGSIKVLV